VKIIIPEDEYRGYRNIAEMLQWALKRIEELEKELEELKKKCQHS
jgi:hypothetical protein